MSVLIEYFTTLHFCLSRMIYIFLWFTLYLDWNFSCCFNVYFTTSSYMLLKPLVRTLLFCFFFFLMSYYGMFLKSHVLVFKVISLHYTFIKFHLLQMCFNIIRCGLHILKNFVSIWNVWGRPYQIKFLLNSILVPRWNFVYQPHF